MGRIWTPNPQNRLFRLGHVDPRLLHPCRVRPHSRPQWQLDRCTHFPFDDRLNHPHLIHPSLDRHNSLSQTASGSTQPFCHSRPTLSGQTVRQTDRHTHTLTDRWARRQVRNISAYAHYIESNALKRQQAHSVLFICSCPYNVSPPEAFLWLKMHKPCRTHRRSLKDVFKSSAWLSETHGEGRGEILHLTLDLLTTGDRKY